MTLNEAQEDFKSIISRLNDDDKLSFFNWLKSEYRSEIGQESTKESKVLDKIAKYLKKKFPFGSSKFCDEKLLHEIDGITIEIDGFLYDDDDVDDLVNQGLVSRHYCKNCDSKDIGACNLITHSVSRETLHEIFNYYLDRDLLKGKKILDVGSRIGSFLYGSYLYTIDCEIYGVEMNADLCLIQQEIIDKFKFGSRIKVINDNILNCSKILALMDVIFLHNVFEFFISNDDQIKIWKFLKENIRKEAILVTIPSIETMIANLLEENFVENWLFSLSQPSVDGVDESKVYLYQIDRITSKGLLKEALRKHLR